MDNIKLKFFFTLICFGILVSMQAATVNDFVNGKQVLSSEKIKYSSKSFSFYSYWPSNVPNSALQHLLSNIPFKITVFKMDNNKNNILGFHWSENDNWVIKFNPGKLKIIKVGSSGTKVVKEIKINQDSIEVGFYSIGFSIKSGNQEILHINTGTSKSTISLITAAKSTNIQYEQIDILDFALEWYFLRIASKNINEAEALFKKNIKNLSTIMNFNRNLIYFWKNNIRMPRNSIAGRKDSIIKFSSNWVPILMQNQDFADRYGTLVQYASNMNVVPFYLGSYFPENWYKHLGGMPEYQDSVRLKKRIKNLVNRAWTVGKLELKRGVQVKQDNVLLLSFGIADSFASIQNDEPFTGLLDEKHSLNMARGEGESCQIVLTAGDNKIENLSLSLELEDPKKNEGISWKLYSQEYVKMTEPYAGNIPATRGGDKSWPDPLIRWDTNKKFKVQGGCRKVFWLTFNASKYIPAGEYRALIKLTKNSSVIGELPIKIKIFNFDISGTNLLNLPGLNIKRKRNFQRLYRKHPSVEQRRAFESIMFDYHLNPLTISKSPDIQDLDYCYKKGMKLACMPKFDFLAKPRNKFAENIRFFGSKDGIKYKYIPGKCTLIPQGDADLLDWDIIFTPQKKISGYKFIKIHNSERYLTGLRYFNFVKFYTKEKFIELTGDGEKSKISVIEYYENDFNPLVKNVKRQKELSEYIKFDQLTYKNKNFKSIVLKVFPQSKISKIKMINSQRKHTITEMQKVYHKIKSNAPKGLKIISFGFDEVKGPYNFCILSALKCMKKAFPDVKTVTTAIELQKTPECYKYLDYICPNSSRLFYEKEKKYCEKYGTKMWIYAGGGPYYPYPNFERVDQPLINSRAFFWPMITYKLSGWLYWEINYWAQNYKIPASDLKWPQIWKYWNVSQSQRTNGMSALLYPGSDGLPVPSRRMEAMRDGIEDYKYFMKAENLLKTRKFEYKGKYQQIKQFIEESKHILSPGFTGFNEDPKVLYKIRNKLALFIEFMIKLPAKKSAKIITQG